MNRLLSLSFLRNVWFCVALFLSGTASAQVVGGHLNNEPTPKVAEAGKLAGGGYAGDVNLFNGTYSANIPLGTVSTPAGLSYTLNHSYSGSHTTGGVPEICKGIPYGEGWQVDLPSITVETDEYHKFSVAKEQNENDPNHYQEELNYGTFDGSKENEIYWYNVHVNIPGVASGRAVFKHIDENDNDCAVFVLNKFEQSIEIRFHGSFWMVTIPNGDIYEFYTNLAPYNNASNRRVIFYENDNTDPNYSGVNDLLDIVFSGIYNSSLDKDYRQAVLNVIEPKVSYSTWYCDRISNRNTPYQGIVFQYNYFGEFNYFKEFQQINMPWAFHQRLGNSVLPYTHDYTSYRDVLLRKVSSYVLETPLDIIDLEYETDFSVLATSGNRMVNYTQEGSGRLDSLYSYKNLLHNGEGIADFQNWSRYQHQSEVGGSPTYSNPYVSGNTYFKSSVDTDDEIPFDHSFLASPRLLTANDFVPGDIYEIRTKVKRNSTSSLVNGNGLLDVKIVSGTRGYNQENVTTHTAAPNLSNGNITVGEFDKYNGIELFSTHNRAIKWSITHNTSSVTTSNYFVLPNIPSYFGGLSIQIGPANSDHNFSIDDLINTTEVPNAYNTYHHMNLGPNTPRSASTLPHSFGVGMPWSLVLPIYQFKMTGGDLGQIDEHGQVIGNSIYNFWAKSSTTSSTGWTNIPTKFDENVKLSEVQLLRYSKNPYMLKSVKQYRINGEYNANAPLAAEDTSHVLLSHKAFEYHSVLDNVFENFNYANNDPILVSNKYKQVKVYLSRVREIPVNDEFVAIPAQLDTAEIPTTFLSYTDYSEIPQVYHDTLVLGVKVRVLTNFVDHLGGHTRINYYPITHMATYSQHNYSAHWSGIADLGVAQRYGLNKAFTIFPAVKELIKWDEKNLDISNPSLSGHKKWTYVYDINSTRLGAMTKPSTNLPQFRYRNNSRQTYRGFKKTTVFDPPDDSGNRSYTEYAFYGKEIGQPLDITDYLLIGKLKESKSYSHNGQIQSETLIEYDYTRAFVNGRDRPNFLKDATYYELMMGESEYRDWYKEDYFVAQDINGDPVTGYEAHTYITTPHFNGQGGYLKRPRFLEYHFYEDLLTINPSYLFNSYFVKKVKERTRTYEDQLAKSTILQPVVLPWVYGEDATFINDITNDTECDWSLKTHILNPQPNSKNHLLAQGKIGDSLLVMLVESDQWVSSDKRQLLINQNGLSATVWEQIFEYMTKFTPTDLVEILEYQPVVITPIQYSALNDIDKRPSDEFLERVFTKNDYLQDTIMLLILQKASDFPGNQVDSIFVRQPQLSENVLDKFIQSKYISKTTRKEVASKNVLTDYIYKVILSKFKDVEVEYVISSSPSYPSDSILSLILNKDYDTSIVISIFQASPREFSEWLENKVKAKYPPQIADIILEPNFNINGLQRYCNNALLTGRSFIDNITEYSYYEANERGRTLSEGFIDLLGMHDVPGRQVTFNGFTKTIDSLQLKHEPSWQVYSVKKSSPQLGGAFSQEKHYYYYDLLNRYDRWWFMYDGDGGMRSEPYITTFLGQVDTVANVYVWDDEYNFGALPQIDGMMKSREHTLKTIPFQTTTVSKNRTDEFALSKSTYYDYDARWFPDDFTTQQVVDYEGVTCPEIIVTDPCERIYDCTPCYLYKYTAPHVEEMDLPYGYCSYTNLGGNTYFCPMNLDVTPWFGNNYVTNLCKDGYGGPGDEDESRAQIPQQILSKTLQLRSVYTQLDTLKYESGTVGYIPNSSSALDKMSAFFRLKLDTRNTDIVEFWMGAPDEMDTNNRLPYRMIFPKDALRTTYIHQRNRYLQPTLTENSVGLKTRYYYNNAQYFFYNNTNCLSGLGSYTSALNTDIGLPYRVTVGYERADSLSTTYAYTKMGMLKETVSPNMKKMNYTFDIYNRLYEVREAETRLLSQNTYHYWDHNQTLDFEERAQMNYVMSTIFSDETTREWKKAFIDPLGRDFGAISAVDAQQKQVHSGAVVYDNLGRVIEAHKPHYLESAQFVSVKNYNVPSMQTVYENAPKSRALRTYDFGVDQNSTHYSANTFHITNNVYTACELELSTPQIELLFGTGNSSSLRFYRNESHDQDGKKLISYTNAIGQQIATLRYVGLDEKVKTLFAYDSYGNLTKTINANHQETDYKYNILGQLYMETTPDAGEKRYMYNKQGQVSAVQDEIARANKDENNDPAPYYRKFEFDDYGRLLAVKRVYYSPYHDAFRYSDGWIHDGYDEPVQDGSGDWNYLKYTFSNSMTMDWLGDYTTFAWVAGGGGGNTPGKITLYGLPDGGSVYEKKWAYGTESVSHNLGQLVEVESYDNKGLPFQGTQYPVQQITYRYNDLEQLGRENISFNPTGLGGSNDPLLTVESNITYADYNYRGALLKKQVDVNGDNVIDLTYFNVVDDWNRLREVYVALGDAQDATQASKVATYDYNDALGQLTDKQYYAYNNLINDDDLLHHTAYTYDVRDRLEAVNSNLMDYRLYYDNQLVGPDSWGEPIMHGFNHNGNINGAYVQYDWTHTDMPVNAQMDEQLLYGYTYDKLNRLTRADATVGDYVTDQQHANLHDFYRIGDVNYKYDHIGNLKQTVRILPETFANNALEVQELNYGYQNDRNRLQNVYKTGVYNRSFTYDLSGNLLTDSEKGITKTDYGRAAYPFTLWVTNPATSQQFAHSYLYDADDLRIFKGTEGGSSSDFRMEYYLKDIAVYDMIENEWTYYVSTNERIAKIIPIEDQVPANNGSNTNFTLKITQLSFYETDHLGNTRIVFSPEKFNADGTILRKIHFAADYYPYGKTLRYFETSTFEEKYLTTQHERDRETGFDYRGARYYDSDLGRFLSLDPLASKFPAWSPYNYVMGNPIMLIDPDGRAAVPPSTHVDKDGNVIAVFDDGDNGVYQHGDNADGGTPTEYMITKRHEKKGASAGGTKVGETEYWDEFVSPETGETMTNHKLMIGKSFNPLIKYLAEQALKMDLREIAANSGPQGLFDVKNSYKNTGALLNGKYATSRSAGNYLAGYNAQGGTYFGVSIDFVTFQKLAGALHVKGGLTTEEKADIVVNGTSYGPAPAYGEVMYQYRMSKIGWVFSKMNK